MPISEYVAGSESASATEWSLTTDSSGPDTDTTDGVFQIFVDLSDMAAGDEIQIRVYEKVRSTDTQRIVYQCNLFGPQSPPVWVSPSLILMHGWDATLKVVTGGVNITWSIRQLS